MKKIVKVVGVLFVIGIIIVLSINKYVCDSYEDKIVDISNIDDISGVDAIVVLGAGVNENQVSLMLRDRLDKAIEVFDYDISDTILMSGDGISEDDNEVKVMKDYAIDNGINVVNIEEDNKGLSTYDSIYRLKSVYDYDKVLIVTQKYHLYRSLYIANEIGIDAYGFSAEEIDYRGQLFRDVREILARNKDYVLTLVEYEV